MPRRVKLGCLAIVLAGFFAFCTSLYFNVREAFFSPPVKLSGEKFDASHIAHVAAEIGIVFPLGTAGLEYHYQHGQDPYGFAKLSVPAGKVEAMLAGAKIVSDPGSAPVSDPGLSWWHPDALTKVRQLSGKRREWIAVRCIVGEEAGQTIVYVAWFNF